MDDRDDRRDDPRPGAADQLPPSLGDDTALDASLDAFVARIAPPLRAAERLEGTFEDRLMARVRLQAAALPVATLPASPPAARPAAWWRRPRTLTLSPLATLACAAAFAGIVCLGTLAAAGALLRGDAPTGGASPALAARSPAAPDTVHLVRFVFLAPRARSVALLGSFNDWERDALPLTPAGGEGMWAVTVPLPAGRYEYAFVVDGERWVADPFAPAATDDFDTESSIITVGSAAARSDAHSG